jgi:hypothetical protein
MQRFLVKKEDLSKSQKIKCNAAYILSNQLKIFYKIN